MQFLLFVQWKLQYSEYTLDIEYFNVVFEKVDIEYIHQLWIWLLLFGLWALNMSMWRLDNCIDMMLPECMFVIARWKHQLEWKHDKHHTCYRFAKLLFFLASLQNSKNVWVMAFENKVMRLYYLFLAIRVTTWSFEILENMDF